MRTIAQLSDVERRTVLRILEDIRRCTRRLSDGDTSLSWMDVEVLRARVEDVTR